MSFTYLLIYRFLFNLFLFLIIYLRENVYPLTSIVYHSLDFACSETWGASSLPSAFYFLHLAIGSRCTSDLS